MESAEAILENENNSNVESESNLRQQLSNQGVAAQDESTKQNVSAIDFGSELNQSHLDPVHCLTSSSDALKNSVDNEMKVTHPVSAHENEELREEESDKPERKSDHDLSESVNFEDSNINNRSPEQQEDISINECEMNDIACDKGTAELTDSHHHAAQESVLESQKVMACGSGSKESGCESDEKIMASETAVHLDSLKQFADDVEGLSIKNMQKVEEENKNMNDSLEQVTDCEILADKLDDEKVEDVERDEGENSNSEPPDLVKESEQESETLLQFSPLVDNDIAPQIIPDANTQSYSLEKENEESTLSDNNSVSHQQTSNKTSGGVKGSVVQNMKNVLVEEKEIELTTDDEEMGSKADNVIVSQEDENLLLDESHDKSGIWNNAMSEMEKSKECDKLLEDENGDQVASVRDEAKSEKEVEFKECDKISANTNVDQLASSNDEAEMEVESKDCDENLSELSNTQVIGNDDKDESGKDVESGGVSGKVVETKLDKLINHNLQVESDVTSSLNNVTTELKGGAVLDKWELSKPSTSENISAGTEVNLPEDMEISNEKVCAEILEKREEMNCIAEELQIVEKPKSIEGGEANISNSNDSSRDENCEVQEYDADKLVQAETVKKVNKDEIMNKSGTDSSLKSLENESVDNSVLITNIKKEIDVDSYVEKNVISTAASNKELKKEVLNEDDDIVILDDTDDHEGISVKKERQDEKERCEGSSGIQIAAVSGQEYKLHSDATGGIKRTTDDDPGKVEKISTKSKTQKCIVCQKVTKCKFNIVRGGDTKQLCDDICFKKFRKSPALFLTKPTPPPPAAPQNKLAAIQPKTGSVILMAGDGSVPSANIPVLSSILKSSAPSGKSGPEHQQQQHYKTCSVCQVMNVQAPQTFCNWKGFDFCGEICLGKFQSTLKSNCSNCFAFIPNEMRASYCTKIGTIMHPFCKQMCVVEFMKKLKTCACCKQDLSAFTAVIARVGANERPREFCSQACVKKLEDQTNDVEIVQVEPGQSLISMCSVCNSQANAIKHTVRFQTKTYKLCSDLCLSAFQYTNKINLDKCSGCGAMCTSAQTQPYFVQFEGETKRFCSDRCIGTFRLDNRKLTSCSWCAARKVNFDMIERQDENDKYQLFCSLNCLSLFRVNLQAKSNMAVECDRCRKIVPAQYHLTMSDASVRNFCSYSCVMQFQSQFTARITPPIPPLGPAGAVQQKKVQQLPPVQLQTPPALQQQQQPAAPPSHPHGTRNRGKRASKGTQKTQQPPPIPAVSNSAPSIPVISSVVSLANEDVPPDNISGVKFQEKAVQTLLRNLEKKGALVTGDGRQRIVVESPLPKMMKNKALQCKPICQTKATACRPHSQHKEIQTDEHLGKPLIVPVPVPIYIPMPTVMYQAPAPVPVPFPVPIPVPIFIPTTRKSAGGILKTIKEIQERMPADPLEAEILMMAEAVATDGKMGGDSDSDSETEVGDNDFDSVADEGDSKLDMKEKEGEGRTEDMIQMALRMAEEMTGPMEDLETSVQPVAVNSISGEVIKTEQPMVPSANCDHQVDPDYTPIKSGRGRGSKRASRGRQPTNNSRPKRQRTMGRSYAEPDVEPDEPPPTRVEITEPPPDTDYRLKFTYGVNAWKHWVVMKNTELENVSKNNPRVRQLPLDVLKCTMDQLHYSLCLFIKEVRKPNGDPYSPDSIYYLCLGIQQYLYENGRIDNIFTDLYFQSFTDLLHDILKTLQPKVNSQGQMLCRIEEEHLWESKQLGAHSPYVLLNTLIYFHTKHFILKTAADHMSLSFAQILKHWKKGVPVKGGNSATPKNASLRFYCLANNKKQDAASLRKGKEGGVPVYEVTENFDNPLRCPVKLYEFFLSKCPESIKNRNDIFYPIPERSCVPDSPVWYSTQSIEHHTMDKMLTRILLVREIQEAHLHAQPTYIKM